MTFKEKQKLLFKYSQQLRKNPTEAELKFKSRLDSLGIKYIFQKCFIQGNNFCIVDFYLPKPYKICIEIDGEYHETVEQKRKDYYRDKYLTEERRFKVIRIKNSEVDTFDFNF